MIAVATAFRHAEQPEWPKGFMSGIKIMQTQKISYTMVEPNFKTTQNFSTISSLNPKIFKNPVKKFRAQAARTWLGGTIWDELFGGPSGPPPPPKYLEIEAKCNSHLLEAAILEVF